MILIPIGYGSEVKIRLPIVTIVIILISFFLRFVDAPLDWAVIPGKFQWYTLFTHIFIHNSWIHFVVNMMYLAITCSLIEHLWGRAVFLICYLSFGMISAGMYCFFSGSQSAGLMGSSVALSGILGVFFVIYPKMPIKFLLWFIRPKIIIVQSYLIIPIWFGFQFISRVYLKSATSDFANICGFILGALCAYVLSQTNLADRVRDFYQYDFSDPFKETLKDAKKLLDKQEYAQALDLARSVLKKKPTHPGAHLIVASVKEAQDMIPAAIMHWKKAIGSGLKKKIGEEVTVNSCYLKLTTHAPDTRFNFAQEMIIAQNLAEYQWIEPAHELYRKLWEESERAFQISHRMEYAAFLIDVCEDYTTAHAVLETTAEHPELVGKFREKFDYLMEIVEGRISEYSGASPFSPSGPAPVSEKAAKPRSLVDNNVDSDPDQVDLPLIDTPAFDLRMDRQETDPPIDDYGVVDLGNVEAPSIPDIQPVIDSTDTFGMIDIDQPIDQPKDAPSSTLLDADSYGMIELPLPLDDYDLMDFGVVDLQESVQNHPEIRYQTKNATPIKITDSGIKLKLDNSTLQLDWSDMTAVSVAKVKNRLRVDLIQRQKEDALFMGYSLDQNRIKTPRSLNKTAAQLLTKIARTAHKKGCVWLFMKEKKALVPAFTDTESYRVQALKRLKKLS